jgi:hypothetical protein
MNASISDVISGTPTWVFLLLAYLIWQGSNGLRSRVRPLVKVWITPAIFILWGLIGLVERSGNFSSVVAHWLIGAVLGGALGVAVRVPLRLDRGHRLVWLPGSVLPLTRVLLIFGAHYLLNVAAALQPSMHDTYMNWNVYVSGASAGYFIGWAIGFVQSCKQAPHTDLSSQLES